ncbi:MAG: ribonuclease P Rpr2/Rpp21/SNM1 subunit family protein [Nitrososphaerales archaeon]
MNCLSSRKNAFPARRQKRQALARTHISRLFELALDGGSNNLADQRIKIARNISTRFNVRLKEKKKFLCKNCKSLMILPGRARYRMGGKRKAILATCLSCGSVNRRFIVKKATKTY